MSAQEIYDALKEAELSLHQLAEECYIEDFDLDIKLGERDLVEQYDRGDDSAWWSVIHFKDHNVYLKISGWYRSYSGTRFGCFDDAVEIVEPQQQIITVFKSIK